MSNDNAKTLTGLNNTVTKQDRDLMFFKKMPKFLQYWCRYDSPVPIDHEKLYTGTKKYNQEKIIKYIDAFARKEHYQAFGIDIFESRTQTIKDKYVSLGLIQ